jgi:uridylate kinase
MIKYNRILLKLSGESLMGNQNFGIDENKVDEYASQLAELAELKVQTAIVIGGGNIFRGLKGSSKGFDRVKGDQMGMLATVINSLALSSSLKKFGVITRVFSAIRMEPIADYYSIEAATKALENREIIIIAGGTGNPFFTTDSASALRAIEIGADIMLKGTRVDGVYTSDPEKNPHAEKFDEISFDEIYNRNLQVMDLTATTLCRDNKMPILVFNMDIIGNLKMAVSGEKLGTKIS